MNPGKSLTSRHNRVKHHSSFFHHISAVLLRSQILSSNLHGHLISTPMQSISTRISNEASNRNMLPSLPTVAKYVPSAEKEMLLIEPWQICHLEIGLLYQKKKNPKLLSGGSQCDNNGTPTYCHDEILYS